jgi:tripartite ATP-independent transporter DctP family solute receptor
MRKNRFLRLIGAMAVSLTASLAIAPAHAEQIIRLGWASPDSDRDPYGIGANAFKKAIEEKSNGEIKVQFYPNRQLGDERQLVEGVRFGTIDAAIATNAVLTQLEPAFLINDLPFLITDAQQGRDLLDGEVGAILTEKAMEKGIVVLGYLEGGFRHMINNVRPVVEPADVQGVKYRVMQNPLFIDMFTSLGGAAIPMAWGETFTAVQQGTIDGLEGTVGIAAAGKLFDVSKFLSLTNHTYSVGELMMSKRYFDQLTESQQELVREAGIEAVKAQRQLNEENTKTLLAELRSQGLQVNDIKDPLAFREAVKPLHEKYRDRIGPDLYDKAMQAVN